MRKRLQNYNIRFGQLKSGPNNAITDVPGVKIGHSTVWEDEPIVLRTGVTSVIPAEGDLLESTVLANVSVINGFSKSVGLIQIEELGNIETPILLTNTLSVGVVTDALVQSTLETHPECRTLNAVVTECNDSRLNSIQNRGVTKEHVFKALADAKGGPIQTGTVGAGTGMVCFGYKGGIGTASRVFEVGDQIYTVGALVLTNFGKMHQLTIKGQKIQSVFPNNQKPDVNMEGSIIVILGTNLPLSCRQLRRLSKRSLIGIARTGGSCDSTSGEIVIAFSNANRVPRKKSKKEIYSIHAVKETDDNMSLLFAAVIDSVEEAIIDSLFTAETVQGIDNHIVRALPIEKLLSRYDFCD